MGDNIMTPKQIAKQLKSRGYGKQHLYCQLCRKQCRDENGFRCHMESPKHLMRVQIFAENEDGYVEKYSDDFERGMVNIMRTIFKNQLVPITTIHHKYITARSHTRLNGTRWETLDDFAIYLGKAGKAEVKQTPGGFDVMYIERDPEAVSKQEKLFKEKAVAKTDEQIFQQQLEKIKQKEKERQVDPEPVSIPSEVDVDKTKEIKITFGNAAKPKATVPTQGIQESVKKDVIEQFKAPDSIPVKSDVSKQVDINHQEDSKKRKVEDNISQNGNSIKQQKTSDWIAKGIVVKVMNKQLANGKYYKQKGVIEDVIDGYIAILKMLEIGDKLKIDQDQLETVIPQVGGLVRIVRGKYKGESAKLLKIDEAKFSAQVILESGLSKGLTLWQEYEDICKIHAK